jgi:hypothetical protein
MNTCPSYPKAGIQDNSHAEEISHNDRNIRNIQRNEEIIPPEATQRPSGDQATHNIHCLCPVRPLEVVTKEKMDDMM